MVGVLTDYVFKDPTMVGYSLGVTYAVCGILGTSIILIGRSAFGQASRAVSWEANTIA
jgi:hypothetical protein